LIIDLLLVHEESQNNLIDIFIDNNSVTGLLLVHIAFF